MVRFKVLVCAIALWMASCAGGAGGSVAYAQANIAGTLYASNFADWSILPGTNGPFSWSSPSACRVTSGGVTFTAFAQGGLIRIVDTGNPSASENVTVNLFTTSGSGCGIEVTPSNQHYSFYLTSATGGLQELLNYAAGLQYLAVLTPDFTRVGGTTATLGQVLGSFNVNLVDARTELLTGYTWNGTAYVAVPVVSPAAPVYVDSFPGSDECAKANAAVASLAGAPGVISTGNGKMYAPCYTTINLPLNVLLECNNSWLTQGTTNTPLVAQYGGSTPTTSLANGGTDGCILSVPLNGSGIPLTSPSTTTTVGLAYGGDPQGLYSPSTAWGAFMRATNTWLYGFHTGIEYGNNTWLLNFDHDRIAQGYNAISPVSGTTISNSGEKDVFTNGAIYNNSGCGFQGYGYTQQWAFSHMSFDYNAGGAVCNVSGFGAFFEMNAVHLENTVACFINLAGSYQSTGNMTDVDVFVNAPTGTFNGIVCGANGTSSFDIKGLSVQSTGATINYAVYTGGIASTHLCMTDTQYLLGSTKTELTPTDAVLAICGADSFGASIARIIPTFVAPTGTTAYGLQVTAPTGGTSNNQAINTIGGIQVSNVGGVSGTGDLYVLQGRNYGPGGAYANLQATINYISDRFYGPTQTWGLGLFGNATLCAEDLTNLTGGAATCVFGIAPASPINSIAIGTGAVTVNDNLTVNNVGGASGTAELDATVQNLGSGSTFIKAVAGSNLYAGFRATEGSQTYTIGVLGGADLIIQSFNGSTTRNVVDINSGAPASSMLVTSGGSLSVYGGYAIQSNTVIPVTATGYAGGASDTLVQLASGTGGTGVLPMYDAYGGLTSSVALGYTSGAFTVNNNLVVNNAGGAGGTGELDVTVNNLGAGSTFSNVKSGSNSYAAFRVENGSNAWSLGNLGGLDLVLQHFNGSTTNNVMDINYAAPANSLNIAGTTGFASFVGGVNAASYSVGSNVVLPVGLLGYHGATGSSLDDYVQLSDGTPSSGVPGSVPVYDTYGGLTVASYLSYGFLSGGAATWSVAAAPTTSSSSTYGAQIYAQTGGTGTKYAFDTENGDVTFNKNIVGSDLNVQGKNYSSGAGSYLTLVGTGSYYESIRYIGAAQSWAEGMFGANNWCLEDATASHCVVNVAAGASAGALTIPASGAVQVAGLAVTSLTATNCVQAYAGGQLTTTAFPCGGAYKIPGTAGTATISANSCSQVFSVSYTGAVSSSSSGSLTLTANPSTISGWNTGAISSVVVNSGTAFNVSLCNSSLSSVTTGSFNYILTETP